MAKAILSHSPPSSAGAVTPPSLTAESVTLCGDRSFSETVDLVAVPRKRKPKKRLSPAALAPLPRYKRWLREIPAQTPPPPREQDALNAARGIVNMALFMIAFYGLLGVAFLMLAGCGGGGGGTVPPVNQKPSEPSGPDVPPATPKHVEPGAFKHQGYFCIVLPSQDAACRIGAADSRWMPAADVKAARVAPAHFDHLDGVYTGTLDGVALTLSVVGSTLSGQSANGCSVNGTWSRDGVFFIFAGSASCAGGGVQLSGLIAFVPSTSGPQSNGVRMLLAARGGSDARITFLADGAPNAQPTPTDCSSRPKPADQTRFATCPSGTGPGVFAQTRTAVCSAPPEWSFGAWTPATPSAQECPPIVEPPPSCGPKPADGARTSTECPAGLVGSWPQSHTWIEVAYPQCWEPTAWTPDSAPVGACDVPPPPQFIHYGRWTWDGSTEFCDIGENGSLYCVLAYNSAQQIMSGSILPGGVGVTRSFKNGAYGPPRPWEFLDWSIDANNNRLTLGFSGEGAPPGAGTLLEMRRAAP